MNIMNLGSITANNYLLTLTNGYMLVDTGYINSYRHFLSKLSKRKIKIDELTFIFLTHAHDDHAGFLNEILLQNPNIQIILHPNAVAGLQRGQNSFRGGCSGILAYVFCKSMTLFGKGEHRFPILDQRFEQNFIFYGSPKAKALEEKLSIQFFETFGHTNCSISLLYEDVLFCGDAAMNGFPSVKRITIWIEDRDDFYHSWEKMISLKPKIIYPGHGKPFMYADLQQFLPYIKHLKTILCCNHNKTAGVNPLAFLCMLFQLTSVKYSCIHSVSSLPIS